MTSTRRTGPDWRHTLRTRCERLTPDQAKQLLANHMRANGVADLAYRNLAGGPTTPEIERHVTLALALRAGMLTAKTEQRARDVRVMRSWGEL